MAPGTGFPSAGPQAKFPSTTDFNQVFNRINLSLSKHNSFLQNIRARHPPPPPPETTAATAPSTTGTGFSSLAAKSSASSASAKPSTLPPRHNHHHHKTRADLDAEEAQFAEHSADVAAAFALGANAGIGYVPERKAAERAAGDRDLRGRLLGKRAREQREEAATGSKRRQQYNRRRGADNSDDDDEEVGRSGLGRSKKKKKEEDTTMMTKTPATAVTDEAHEMQEAVAGVDLPQLERGLGTGGAAGSVLNLAVTVTSNEPEAAADLNEAQSSPVADEQSHKTEHSWKKKKKKKNKKAKKKRDIS